VTEQARFSAEDVRAHLSGTAAEAAQACAESLAKFLNLLAQWNRVYNLTGFRKPQDLLERVLSECLLLGDWLQGRSIADVGSGAGLPGLPLAISHPQRRFTLIESRAKRVHFLRHVVGSLGLANVSVEHCRAEDLPAQSGFDTLLARAVAAPPEFMTIARCLTRPGSRIVLATSPEKGELFRAELKDAPEPFRLHDIVPAGDGGKFGVVVVLERAG
jgi:16S rRNA (guanine527-N7)-methyltransferase